MHWILGGNKKFYLNSKKGPPMLEKSYFITLQFEKLLLRLSWTPHEHIQMQQIHGNTCRVFPISQAAKQIHIENVFQDRWQFHSVFSVFAEQGFFRNGLDLNVPWPLTELENQPYLEKDYIDFMLHELRPSRSKRSRR